MKTGVEKPIFITEMYQEAIPRAKLKTLIQERMFLVYITSGFKMLSSQSTVKIRSH